MAAQNINTEYGNFEIGEFEEIFGFESENLSDDDLNDILAHIMDSDMNLDETEVKDALLDLDVPVENVEMDDTANLATDTIKHETLDMKEPIGQNLTSTSTGGSRFATVLEDDLDNIFLKGRPKNTLKTTHWGVNIFKQWLAQHGKSEEFEVLPVETLSKLLRHFYAEVRTTDGHYYAKSSYVGLRAAIHRHLRAPPFERNISILQDKEFLSANNVFLGILRKIKQLGLDNASHHEPISQGDLNKIRECQSVDNPLSLQQKVWFDITLGFGRRGCENQRELKFDSFAVETDDVGVEFISMTHSEATKNHPRGVHDKGEGKPRIYATGKRLCPVASFKKYRSKLNPKNPAFFQLPRKSVTESDPFWYTLKPLGHNSLSNMMKTISSESKLSRVYTNHCVRATTVTLLSHAGVEAREIVKLTGHRNQQSLSNYNTDSSSEQKRQYSAILQGSGNQLSSSTVTSNSCYNQVNLSQNVRTASAASFQISQCNVTVNNYFDDRK